MPTSSLIFIHRFVTVIQWISESELFSFTQCTNVHSILTAQGEGKYPETVQSRCHVSLGDTMFRRALQRAAIYNPAALYDVPPLTVTSILTAGGRGTVVHCLRRHAQLGGWVPSGLGWGLLPRSRTSHFFLSSAPAVATTDGMEGLRAYREALSTGEGLRKGYGHTFLGVRHGNWAHT